MKKPEKVETVNGNSLWRDALRRFLRNKPAMIGLIVLSVLLTLCILAPLIAPYSVDAQDLSLGASPPGRSHFLGSDILGRDLFSRILYGGQISFAVGLCATLVSVLIGVSWGAIAGWVGGRTDVVMMRIVDIAYAFPFTIFVIILMVFFERSLLLLFAAIGAVEWLTMARIVRGQVMALKNQEFIDAAIGLGLSNFRIITRHILPNITGPIIVYATLTIPAVMLLEAFLSFLGLGVQPPASSWGILIREGAESMEEYPWLLIFPGAVLSATLFALNFIGDGLRDALDPRSSKE
ncbi:MAG: ABC transporter permease subunit [Fibrobacter sp.]|jgi:oligopeptide transport system permease protein|nr:ABC transporter permease subunit [Fibrobacter sp.]